MVLKDNGMPKSLFASLPVMMSIIEPSMEKTISFGRLTRVSVHFPGRHSRPF